jgi:hypothetical protein
MKQKSPYDLDAIKRKIRKAMKEQETYSPAMDITIELTARNYLFFLMASDGLIKSGKLTVNERTRENHIKKVVAPEYATCSDCTDKIRKLLRELRLTRATIEGGAEIDDLTELSDKVADIKEGKSILKKPKTQDNGE